jgi:hypothetical protein
MLHTSITVGDLPLRHLICLVDIIGALVCLQSLFFFPFAFVKKGRERTKILKIILEAHQSCNNDITDIVGKISRR